MTRYVRVLMYGGTVAIVAALAKIHARFIADPPYSFTGSFRFAWALAYIAMLIVATYGVGLPDLPGSKRSALGPSVVAALAAATGISLVQLLVGDALLPRFVVFGTALLLVPWCVFCSALAKGGRVQAEDRDLVVVVAGRNEAATMEEDLQSAPERPARIVAVLEPAEIALAKAQGQRRLVAEAKKSKATIIVLSHEAQEEDRVVTQAAFLHEGGLRVRTMSMFYEQWLGKLPLTELERVSMLFDIGELHDSRYVRFKRLLDLVVATVGLAVVAVCIPFVALGNLFFNRGSLFYSQVRVGKNAELFEILKFRTMRAAGPDDAVGEWTSENDPRITPFGRLLRTTHLDELPQMVNIMRGELSIVGPRPEQPQYVAELAEKLRFYELRHLVRPGLTGWAQVKYGYAGDEADALEKLQYEFYYLRHQSLRLDLRIIGRTVRSVIGRGGR